MFEIKKGSIINYSGYDWEIEDVIYGNDNVIILVRLDEDNDNKKVINDMFIHEYYQIQWDKLKGVINKSYEECYNDHAQAYNELDDILFKIDDLENGNM